MSALPENPGQSVQCAVQCDVQSEPVLLHVFDEEVREGWLDPLNDLPIPYRLVADVERGATLDEIDARGFVP